MVARPRPLNPQNPFRGGRGLAVDAQGGPVIDPTKNVEDLVRAKGDMYEALRESDTRYYATLREADSKHFEALNAESNKFHEYARSHEGRFQSFALAATAELQKTRTDLQSAKIDAETRRIDQLAETRQEFQNTIRDMLAESVRTTSTLVSTQLVQIQATFDTRVSKLEAQAFTAAGRSSVNDPQIEGALTRMSGSIAALSGATSESIAKMNAVNAESIAKLQN
jgi:DNA anti-recombination protein RmuC